MLIAIGIGLHNLGEGVAIGSAYTAGALALGAFLVVGFALHNTTEGLAIVAPIAHAAHDARAARAARPGRGRARGARRVDRRRGVQPVDRGVPVRLRRRGDRPGHRPARARRCATSRAARCTRRAVGGLLAGHRAHVRDRPAGGRLMAAQPVTPTRSRTTRRRSTRCSARTAASPVTTNDLAERLRRHARVGVGDGQEARRARAGRARALPRRRLTPAGEQRRARGAAPPPAARALPRRAPRRAVGPRARGGRGARARHLRGPRGAHRGEARPPDARPARRPDPRRRPAHRRGQTRAAWPTWSRATAGASCACRTPIRRCCATSTSAASRSATRCEVLERQPFGGPLTVRFGDASTCSAAGSPPRCASLSSWEIVGESMAPPTSCSSGTSTGPAIGRDEVLVRSPRRAWIVASGTS